MCGGLGLGSGGWMPLPTNLRQYCYPAFTVGVTSAPYQSSHRCHFYWSGVYSNNIDRFWAVLYRLFVWKRESTSFNVPEAKFLFDKFWFVLKQKKTEKTTFKKFISWTFKLLLFSANPSNMIWVISCKKEKKKRWKFEKNYLGIFFV